VSQYYQTLKAPFLVNRLYVVVHKIAKGEVPVAMTTFGLLCNGGVRSGVVAMSKFVASNASDGCGASSNVTYMAALSAEFCNTYGFAVCTRGRE
jgi:hypothetical protein